MSYVDGDPLKPFPRVRLLIFICRDHPPMKPKHVYLFFAVVWLVSILYTVWAWYQLSVESIR